MSNGLPAALLCAVAFMVAGVSSIAEEASDGRLKSVPRPGLGQPDHRVDVTSRAFNASTWQIKVAEPKLLRIDLRLTLGADELLTTSIGEDKLQDAQERILDLALGPLGDIEFGQKWRFYAALHGRSGWFCKTIDIPKNVQNAHWHIAGGPVLQGDGSFGLVFFELGEKGQKNELALKIFLKVVTQ